MKRLSRAKLLVRPNAWSTLYRDAIWETAAAIKKTDAPKHQPPFLHVRWPLRYEHPNAAAWGAPICLGFAHDPLVGFGRREIAQPYPGIILFDVEHNDKRWRCAIDYYDLTFVNAECCGQVDTYFKMQHLVSGYPDFANVHPGGYVSSLRLYRHVDRLRRHRRVHVGRTDVYARFGTRFNASQRLRALEIVAADQRLRDGGGTKRVPYMRQLREMAASTVCLDLPGQGPLCYRLVEGLAMGCCVVAPPYQVRLPVMLEPGVHYVACAPDLSDLAEACYRCISEPTLAERIGLAASAYFDTSLTPLALTRQYLDCVVPGWRHRSACLPSG